MLAIAVAAPCCAIHAAPPLPRLHYCCHHSRTATMSTPHSCCKPPDSIIDRAIDRATAETSQKNIINGRLGELKLGASDWMWIYQRCAWNPRPVWPASAAQAADFLSLADARGSPEQDLVPKEASGEPGARPEPPCSRHRWHGTVLKLTWVPALVNTAAALLIIWCFRSGSGIGIGLSTSTLNWNPLWPQVTLTPTPTSTPTPNP